MPHYLVTYHGAPPPANPAQVEQMKQAFGAWLAQAGKAVKDPGAPTRFSGAVAQGSPAATVMIGGYSILEASSLAEAEGILRSHPFVARGGTLQIHEAIAI